jgi:hypothetical protein
MSHPVPARIGSRVPELAAAGERAGMRFLEFFAANIWNPRARAYARSADDFWPDARASARRRSRSSSRYTSPPGSRRVPRELLAPSVKQRLAAIRHLLHWLVTGQVVPVNPAGSMRGPRHVVTSGKRRCSICRKRALLDSIDVSRHMPVCATTRPIRLMVYSFARIGAAVEDVPYAERPAVGAAARERW